MAYQLLTDSQKRQQYDRQQQVVIFASAIPYKIFHYDDNPVVQEPLSAQAADR